MNFRALTSSVYRSRTVRTLSGSVALTILIVQLVVIYPMIYGQYQAGVKEQSRVELAVVRAAFFNSNTEFMEVPETLLSGSLVGLVLEGEDGRLLLNKGNTLGYEHGSGNAVDKSGSVHS